MRTAEKYSVKSPLLGTMLETRTKESTQTVTDMFAVLNEGKCLLTK